MIFLKKILPAAVAIMLLSGLQSAEAQSDIDMNRMNRDINIMENVLEEMFKTRWAAHGNTVRIGSGSFSFGSSNDIRGKYLEDFGVIFTIPGGSPAFVITSDADGDKSTFSFHYGEGDEGEPVTQESITDRMVEFLQDYGSTIGQLSGDDRVMVIYKSNRSDRRISFFNPSEDDSEEAEQIPTISVAATKSDLQAYRSGEISSENLRDRLDISTTNSKSQHKDLRVMAGIFESAFKETDEKSFRIRGSVDYLYLDNFGALFSFDARFGNSAHFDFSGLQQSVDILKEELDVKRAELEEKQKELQNKRDSIFDNTQSKNQEKVQSQEEQKQEAVEAYDQFLSDLKEYIVDYGRTLKSVGSNQHILVSVTLDSRYDEIPESMDLQIQKSVLESMDAGSLSRNQAMEQIQVREY